MLSRRRLIQGAVAISAQAVLGGPARALSRVTAGAIRWDAWYDSENRAAVEATLGPQAWRPRAPWFSRIVSRAAISIDGDRASIMDDEIRFAAAAGLKYWAYCWYGPEDRMQNAWRMHQASTIRDSMNWCLLWQFTDLGGPVAFNANIAETVRYFRQSNYQKVIGGRPLVYLFVDSLIALDRQWGGDWANVRRAFDRLRAACDAAALATPYLVAMFGWPAMAASIRDQISSAAISNYIGRTPHGTPATYAQLDSSVRSYWAEQAATGSPIVPIAMMGWDVRPRKEHPPPWVTAVPSNDAAASFVSAGTVAERAHHLQAAVNYIDANPAACPSRALLIYSWNECDEGGGELCPSLGDPPPSKNSRGDQTYPFVTTLPPGLR